MSAVAVGTERVVYLLGAGATHGCADYVGSDVGLVMPALIGPLSERMRELYLQRYSADEGIGRLVNEVVTEETDFEQLITFLDDAVSARYREFAADLKDVFSTVLRTRLSQVRSDHEDNHSELYAALVDMHQVEGIPEDLQGFLTLNYDAFLEHAIEDRSKNTVDYGVQIERDPQFVDSGRKIPVLKLHGSFGWSDNWPISLRGEDSQGFWIPPGIRKEKSQYPFNAIWGKARELLDCEVVRVIGCNLGPNDWDLVSMLFTTMHTHESRKPFRVEVISRPRTADKIARAFPYLNVLSLLDIPDVGDQIVSEVMGGAPRPLSSLGEEEQAQARDNANAKISNAFEYWLRLRGELLTLEHSVDTDAGIFARFIDSTV